MQPVKSSDPKIPLLVCAVIAVPYIVIFCAAYVLAEVPAYPWDYGAYWGFFQHYGHLIASGADDWPRIVLGEIRSKDYNPAAVVALFPFYAIFGGGRVNFVIAVTLLYLLPAVIAASWISLKSERAGAMKVIAVFLVALTYLPFWTPTLRGMIDIIGLTFLGLATLLVFNSDFLGRRPVMNGIALGVLLWAPFLFRRWYAFSIVAFFAVTFLFGAFVRHRKRGLSWPLAVLSIAAPLSLSGVIVLALAMLFQSDLVIRIVTTSYGDIYDVYQIPFVDHFRILLDRLGGYVLTMMLLGAAIAVITQKIEAAFCFAVAVVTFFLFIRTQVMAPHHFLPVAFWLFPVYMVGIFWLSRWLRFLPKTARLFPFALASMVIFAMSVIPAEDRSGMVGSFFIPRADTKPIHLDNFPEYQRLIADLNRTLKAEDKLVVFASSLVLSDSLLVSLDPTLQPHISYASQIAKVTFFNFDNLRAEYVLVTSPPQTHLKLQPNITIPVEKLISGAGFGSAFEKTGSAYNLADGVTAILYRRIRDVTGKEMGSLVEEFAAIYPDWRSKFQSNIVIPFAARKVTLGDRWGQAALIGPNTVFLHPGAKLPTTISLPFDAAISRVPRGLDFSIPKEVLRTCPDADGVSVVVKFGSEQVWRGIVLPEESERVELPHTNGLISIAVDKRSQPNCDHLTVSFDIL